MDSTNEGNKKLELTNLHMGHRERLRSIMSKADVSTLPEHQLLEFLLTFVLPQKDVNPLAHELLNEFVTIANVFDAKPEALMRVKGVGEVVASFLSFCSKIPEIYLKSRTDNKRKLNSSKEIINFFLTSIPASSNEKFYFVCLSGQGDLLCYKSIGTGSISQLYINTRELVQEILKYPTQSVVVCHTHPQGVPHPSDQDIAFTHELKEILDALAIRLCDHLIICDEKYYSFFHHGLLGEGASSRALGDLKSTMLYNNQFKYIVDKDDKNQV